MKKKIAYFKVTAIIIVYLFTASLFLGAILYSVELLSSNLADWGALSFYGLVALYITWKFGWVMEGFEKDINKYAYVKK